MKTVKKRLDITSLADVSDLGDTPGVLAVCYLYVLLLLLLQQVLLRDDCGMVRLGERSFAKRLLDGGNFFFFFCPACCCYCVSSSGVFVSFRHCYCCCGSKPFV